MRKVQDDTSTFNLSKGEITERTPRKTGLGEKINTGNTHILSKIKFERYFWIWKSHLKIEEIIQFNSVQSLGCIWLSAIAWIEACQASLSITNSRGPPKPMSIVSVMSSNHLILCCPILLLPSIFPSIRVFSNESALCIRWPKYWSFYSTSVLPMKTQDWSPLGWTGWISLQSKGLSRVFSNTTV